MPPPRQQIDKILVLLLAHSQKTGTVPRPGLPLVLG